MHAFSRHGFTQTWPSCSFCQGLVSLAHNQVQPVALLFGSCNPQRTFTLPLAAQALQILEAWCVVLNMAMGHGYALGLA